MEFIDSVHEEIVRDLNALVVKSGVPMEGNLYYSHHQNLAVNTTINAQFAHKRTQLAALAKHKFDVMEIGFNAGHSAALMLHSNPTLRYTGIDIGWHKYTPMCADYLRERFAGRFDLLIGDSRSVYPMSFDRFAACDLIHIDGGHSHELFRIDLVHALTLPCTNADRHLLIDDTEDPWNPAISPELQRWIDAGYVAIDTLGGVMADRGNHLLVKPLKRSAE